MGDAIYVTVWCLVALFLFGMNIWGGWAERYYEKYKDRKGLFGTDPWYWMKVFKVPLSRENCVGHIKKISWVGIAMATCGLIVALVFGK